MSAPNRPAPTAALTAVSYDEEMRRLEPVLPAILSFGVPVSIDTMKAKVAAGRSAPPAPRSSMTSGACSATPTWRAWWREHAAPVLIMHNRETADPAIDIMADIGAFFVRSLTIADTAGIARENIVLDPGHRLRQDAGAEPDRARPLRRAEIVRPAADDRRLAQAFHRQSVACSARPAARRLARRAPGRGASAAP